MSEVRNKGRIVMLALLVVSAFVGIGARLFVVQLKPEAWVLEPMKNNLREIIPVGNRGAIVDRNGEILALDVPAYHVGIDPYDINRNGDPEAVIRCLSREFRISERELRRLLSDTDKHYKAIRKFLPESRLANFEAKPEKFGVEYFPPNVSDGGPTNVFLRGVTLEETSMRDYPKGELMSHVVGFSNAEGIGCAGIELVLNDYLKGKEGRRVSTRDGRRQEIYGTRIVDTPPEDGATVYLTLDQQLQYVVEDVIHRTYDEFQAKAVWAIVQKVDTGEILAMASYPTYDLNLYNQADPEWMRNCAISVNYEPGSVMKAAAIAGALDDDIVREDDLIDCENGYWVYARRALRDSHGMGEITVADVIKHSSNIGTAKIALAMGDRLFYTRLKAFHFGERLGVGLPGEEAGIFYSPKSQNWSKLSITRIGMGQGIAVTSLQMLSMMNAIANDGVQMEPYVVSKVVAPDGEVLVKKEPEILGRPLTRNTAIQMQRLLARVTEDDGTGTKARVEGYTVAGKTGTAQKVNPAGGYYEKNFVSSFAGFLPAEDPQIGIIVVADDPGTINARTGAKENYYGGTVCGPAFSEIAEFAVRYLKIAPDGNRVYVMGSDE
ncbi:MAG: penicillin-binding protein 2 [Pontiellaceae bacterium]|nr:penicillin-binding protein 2 [Pontiellaceae bacterium]